MLESQCNAYSCLILWCYVVVFICLFVSLSGTAPRDFTFDFSYWSFDSSSPHFATNPKVYSDLGVSVLNNAWAGYNCCLFAYGQTGSGKSYSMVGYGDDKGIVPQAMEEMFVRIQANKDKNVKFNVECR